MYSWITDKQKPLVVVQIGTGYFLDYLQAEVCGGSPSCTGRSWVTAKENHLLFIQLVRGYFWTTTKQKHLVACQIVKGILGQPSDANV